MTETPLTIGTAGHIDHGKTALVEALTGARTDRLPEERERGISIELGYAQLELGDRTLSLIDVPGHERFVRTMIAGASGIDLFLLVVAADDGVMPQTREHLTVLRALGVQAGVIALTKCDVVDPEARRRASEGVRELVADADLVEVSALEASGIEALRGALRAAADRVEPAAGEAGASAAPALHVDRSFTLPGQGTIVTGTLWRGTVARGDRLLVLPAGRSARVRSLQVHGRDVERAAPRQRVALNLSGVRRDEVRRGDVISAPGAALRPSHRLDVELLGAGALELASGTRVQVHHGTRETPARVVPLGEGLAQLRLERELLAARGERVVIRRVAPPDTLGGGRVLDPAPARHRDGAAVRRLQAIRAGRPAPDAGAGTGEVGAGGGPRAAKPPPLDRTAAMVFALLRADGTQPRGPGQLAMALKVDQAKVEAALAALCEAGHLVRLKPQLYMPAAKLTELREVVTELAEREGAVTIGALRDRTAGSRRYAQALLEHFDAEGLLLRQGDRHLLRRPAGGRTRSAGTR